MSKTKRFIETFLKIINKDGENVPFVLNDVQNKFMEEMEDKCTVLKARQQGFSSLILAMFTRDFLTKPNSVNVVVADIADNSKDLLARVKHYLQSFGEAKGFDPFDKKQGLLKYNSKYELHNNLINSRYIIGTAEAREFGRSKTITNLHLSEFAFYPDAERLLAGALQAVVPSGRVIIETTANGFNYYKDFWDRSQMGETGFKPMFFKASDFYDADFLDKKKMELGRMYPQEYPETPIEAFIASGDYYFNREALEYYLSRVNDGKEIPQTPIR